MDTLKPVTFRLPTSMVDALEKYANRNNKTIALVVREALAEKVGIDTPEKDRRRQSLQPGSVVRLKCPAAPQMVVERLTTRDGETLVTTCWFDGRQPYRETFAAAVLEIVQE